MERLNYDVLMKTNVFFFLFVNSLNSLLWIKSLNSVFHPLVTFRYVPLLFVEFKNEETTYLCLVVYIK